MKKIIGFIVGTAAVLAIAIGVQANASSGDENKRPPAVSEPTPTTPEDAEPTDASDAPPAGDTESEEDASEAPTAPAEEKTDDGERDGFTEDHTDEPGENK